MGLNELRRLKLEADIPKPKKSYTIPKKSKKRIERERQQMGGDSAIDLWFEARRFEMKGRCVFCGGRTEKDNDDEYRRSIAHLLPKRKNMFPSVSKHPNNWLELCFYGNSCHTNFDNSIITWELLRDSKEWEIIVEKFRLIYPYIAPEEIRNVPDILLRELEPDI